MKFLLVAFSFTMGTSLFAAEVDSFKYSSKEWIDYPVKPYETADTSIRLQVEYPEERSRKRSGPFIRREVRTQPPAIGENYDSVHNINPKVAAFIAVCFISFVLYFVWRVRRSIKKDERNRRRKRR